MASVWKHDNGGKLFSNQITFLKMVEYNSALPIKSDYDPFA